MRGTKDDLISNILVVDRPELNPVLNAVELQEPPTGAFRDGYGMVDLKARIGQTYLIVNLQVGYPVLHRPTSLEAPTTLAPRPMRSEFRPIGSISLHTNQLLKQLDDPV